ncbi:MipA/OmpV family protein [Halomonas sp. FME1]|uniref:MipA/OmpV family protein n=1 Tax=Halomonas casei TaxID=2742613 RepID=A0ABR9F469_9GAMM|nr:MULTISPECIES: MipA/OmpV family protein [Halomonas]MBE0401262.1 MipA/OmpV family protein [Halomonas casei]PCC23125.1 structural protein MipA [Halomonas sp. JB37]
MIPVTQYTWWSAAVIGLAISPLTWADSWEGSIGAGVLYAPDYLGSDDYDTKLWPSINLTYGETFTINPRSGIEWHAIRDGGWTVSPFVGYTFGRDNKGDISAFEEVDGGATLGLRVGYEQREWLYSVAASTPVTGDVDGAEFEVAAAWRTPLSERLFFSLSPSAHYSNEKWTESMFGVSARDSLRSGIAQYNPDGGYWRLGVSSSLTYALTPEWSATGFVGTSYLTGNASDSPIVDELGSDWQTVTGVSLNYNF